MEAILRLLGVDPRTLVASIIAVASLVACELKSQETTPDEEPTTKALLTSIWETECVGSFGYWNNVVASCVCPSHELYQVDVGCSPVSLTSLAQDPNMLTSELPFVISDSRLQVHGSLAGLSVQQHQAAHGALSANPLVFLRGVTLPSRASGAPLYSKLSHVNLATFNRTLGPPLAYDFFLPSELLSTPVLGVAAENAAQVCLEGLRGVEGDQHHDQSRRFVCDALGESLQQLQRNEFMDGDGQPAAAHFSDEGSSCSISCALVRESVVRGYARRFAVYMENYAPMVRFLAIRGPQGAELFAFTDSLGRFIAADFRRIDVESGDDTLGEVHARFDEGFIPLVEQRQGHVARSDLAAALTYESQVPEGSSIGACLVDNGIDVRAQAVWQHIPYSVAPAGRQHGAEWPALPLDTMDGSLWDHATGLVHGEHGAEIAQQLLADLPQLQLTLLRDRDLDFYGARLPLIQRWSDTIRRSQARVVNMSVALAREVANCEGFIGTLMTAHPNVLFVAGMGNSGGENPIGACPVSIAPRHPNLVTVAGTTRDGRHLARDSNYGRATAIVAAPYDVEMLDPIGGQRIERHGTSYATATVSNLALRCLAVRPSASPQQIIQWLMESCGRHGLDVRCGGAVDAERFLTMCGVP